MWVCQLQWRLVYVQKPFLNQMNCITAVHWQWLCYTRASQVK